MCARARVKKRCCSMLKTSFVCGSTVCGLPLSIHAIAVCEPASECDYVETNTNILLFLWKQKQRNRIKMNKKRQIKWKPNWKKEQQQQRRKRKQNPFRMVCKCSSSMLKVVARRTHTRPPRIVYAVSVRLWTKAHTTRRTRAAITFTLKLVFLLVDVPLELPQWAPAGVWVPAVQISVKQKRHFNQTRLRNTTEKRERKKEKETPWTTSSTDDNNSAWHAAAAAQ